MTCAPACWASVAATLPWLSPWRTSSSSVTPGTLPICPFWLTVSPVRWFPLRPPPAGVRMFAGCHVTPGARICRAGRRSTTVPGPPGWQDRAMRILIAPDNSRAPSPPSKPPPPLPKARCASIPTPKPSSFRSPTAAKGPLRQPSRPATRNGSTPSLARSWHRSAPPGLSARTPWRRHRGH